MPIIDDHDPRSHSDRERKAMNNNSGPRWQNLTVQVVVLVILPLTVIVLVVAFGGTRLHHSAMRSLVGERDERATRSIAQAINAQLLHRADLIQSLAIRASREPSLDEIFESSTFLNQEFDMGLAYLTQEGSLFSRRGDTITWNTLLEISEFPMTDDIITLESGIDFSQALPYPGSDNFIIIVYARSDHLSPIALGAFTVASVAHQPLISAFDPGEDASAVLVDHNQQILYSIGNTIPDHINASHPGVMEATKGESGASYFPVNGGEHVIAYSSVPLLDWGVVVEEPWESVSSPLLDTTLLAPLVFIPVLILALVVIWFGARRIVQPLQSLEDRASKLAWGDFQAIEDPVEGIEEINSLQRTLIHMAHKVKVAQQGLRSYISAITTGQEEERRRLARELHDDTIQSLIALKQRAQLASISNEKETNQAKLNEIQEMVDETIRDLRRITRDLRPIYLEDLGLVASLEMLCRETSSSKGIPVEFKRIGNEQRFSREVELTLYRMAQEGLNNVSRHANAYQASILINFADKSTAITISDDGQGFTVPDNPAEFAPGGHYGLLGLHERAELIGAKLKIESAPHQGTRLEITFPTSAENNSSQANK